MDFNTIVLAKAEKCYDIAVVASILEDWFTKSAKGLTSSIGATFVGLNCCDALEIWLNKVS